MKEVIFIISFLICIFLASYYFYYKYYQLDQRFYSCRDLYPELYNIQNYGIEDEIKNIIDEKKWDDWPEPSLYKNYKIDGNWKILPFVTFSVWNDENCAKFPKLTKFLKTIPNLTLAGLSKLAPNTVINQHIGWGKYSNNILRCHYSLILPEKKEDSFVCVRDTADSPIETRYHELNEWIVFDDSKTHWGGNTSNIERTVLILDMKRPYYVKKGTSKAEDSQEIMDFIKGSTGDKEIKMEVPW
jgi:beta-hydroxylase